MDGHFNGTERHGDPSPVTDWIHGQIGAVGASDRSLVPSLQRNATVNIQVTGGYISRTSVVSGNPLPSQDFSNIKPQPLRLEREEHPRHGHATTQAIHHPASQAPAEGREHRDRGDRRFLRSDPRPDAPAHPGPASGDARTHPALSVTAQIPAALTRSLPSISDLLHLAVTETDFVSDLDPDTLEANCANSIDLAADLWSDAHGYATVPLSLIQWARCALLLEAEAMLRDREAHAEAERLDAIEAGDIDAAGCFIPYDTYRSV